MPRPFQNAVLTDEGASLLTRSLAGNLHIEFTKLVVGSGEYSEPEKSVSELQKRIDLKVPQNRYVFSDISVHGEHSVKLTALITNQDPVTKKVLVDEGYYINEIGIYAKEKDNVDAIEVLYSISITSGDKGDYMPAYNGNSPAQITQDFFAVVGNSGDVIINSVGAALLKDGDASDTVVTFNNAEVRENLSSGEKLSTLLGKIGKFLSDLKTVAFSGSYTDLDDKPKAADVGAAPTSHASTETTYGVSTAANYGHAMASSTTPKANGTAAVGSETAEFARGDHVHPLPATLATARTIDGVSFNGSAAIAHYGTCSTAAATAAKVVACTGFTLVTGAVIRVNFTITNTAASPTLNVNGTGAKAIYYRGAAIAAGYLAANRTYEFVYNGTQYELVGDIDTNTTYSAMTGATTTAVGKAGLVPAPAAGAATRYLRSDGAWAVPPDTNTTYSAATTSAAGLMSAADKIKLNAIGFNTVKGTSATTSISINAARHCIAMGWVDDTCFCIASITTGILTVIFYSGCSFTLSGNTLTLGTATSGTRFIATWQE